MTTNTLDCPHCGAEIDIQDAFEGRVAAAVESKAAELESEYKASFNQQVNEQVAQRELQIRRDALSDYALEKESKDSEITDLRDEVKKLRGMAAENEALKLRIADTRDEVRLEEQQKYTQLLIDAKQEGREAAEEEYKPKLSQVQHQLSQTQKALQDADRKAAQGSQQTQGEVAELGLEEALRQQFLTDKVVPVPKGVAGADCKLIVNGKMPNPTGSILIESKATKTFRADYIEKLKSDLADSDATSAVLVTQTLPASAGDEKFMQDGPVTIVHTSVYMLAIALLRNELIKIKRLETVDDHRETIAAQLYSRVTSDDFVLKMQYASHLHSEIWKEDEKQEKQFLRSRAKKKVMRDKFDKAIIDMLSPLQPLMPTSLPLIESDEDDQQLLIEPQICH